MDPAIEAFAGASPAFDRLQGLEDLALRPPVTRGHGGPVLFMFVPLAEIPRPDAEVGPPKVDAFRVVSRLPGYLVTSTPTGLRMVAATLPLWFFAP